jgi:peptide/nickel transport system substrate-binding protein/oligopeptide transport system substrate-binding protein
VPARARVAALLTLVVLAGCTRAPEQPAQPVPGGSIVVAVRDLGSLDPAKPTGAGAQAVIAQLFRSLTTIDAASNRVMPGAASSWTVSRDRLTWRFKIAPGRFSNGATVTADDFKFAFDRIARKATRSDAAFQLELVRGFDDVHRRGTTKTLAGVTVADRSTLVIRLTRPFAELPYTLAHPRLAPLPRAAYARSTRNLDAKPISNGPFTVTSAKLGTNVVLQRNPHYGGRTAYLDSLEFRVVRSIDDGWRAFNAGEVQIAEAPVSVIQSGSLGGGALTPAWATLSFGANLTLEKYKKPDVRRALSLAIDRTAIAQTVYGGTKTPATGVVPEGVRGFRANQCAYCGLDRDRARTMMRTATGGKPPSIVIDHLAESSSRSVARAIQASFQAIGVKATLRAHRADRYGAFLAAGSRDFAQLGGLADVPTPDGFLAQQLRTGSPNNQVRYADKTFDASIDKARASSGEGARMNLYARAERRALSLAAIVPIVFFRNRTVAASSVRGYTLTGGGTFDATAVWLAR